MRPPTAGPRSRLPAQERREQMLDVAAEIVLARGVDGLTMEGVAQAAGVSKGLGYAYFSNRDDILVALFDRECARLDAALAEALGSGSSFEDRVRSVLRSYLDVLESQGLLLRSLLGAQFVDGPIEARQRERTEQLHLYQTAVLPTEFGLSGRQARTASAILAHALNGAIDAWVEGTSSRSEIEDIFVAMCIGGLERLAERRNALSPR